MIVNEPAVLLSHASAADRDVSRVDDLCVTIGRGDAVAFVGGSGSGKDVALRLCAGLESPVAGSVRILGVDPATARAPQALELRRRVGVVFSKPALLSNMTVFENVALPLRYHTALSGAAIAGQVLARLAECGVAPFRDRFPVDLSLGCARLSGLARALVMDPELLCIDELLFGIDAADVGRVGSILERRRRDTGLTVVASINAPTRLAASMDRLVFLRGGRTIGACTPLEAPSFDDPEVRSFVA